MPAISYRPRSLFLFFFGPFAGRYNLVIDIDDTYDLSTEHI